MASERGGWTRTSPMRGFKSLGNNFRRDKHATSCFDHPLPFPLYASWRCVCTAARQQRTSIFPMAQITSSVRGARHASCLLTRMWSKRPSLLPLTWCVACNVCECNSLAHSPSPPQILVKPRAYRHLLFNRPHLVLPASADEERGVKSRTVGRASSSSWTPWWILARRFVALLLIDACEGRVECWALGQN